MNTEHKVLKWASKTCVKLGGWSPFVLMMMKMITNGSQKQSHRISFDVNHTLETPLGNSRKWSFFSHKNYSVRCYRELIWIEKDLISFNLKNADFLLFVLRWIFKYSTGIFSKSIDLGFALEYITFFPLFQVCKVGFKILWI